MERNSWTFDPEFPPTGPHNLSVLPLVSALLKFINLIYLFISRWGAI